MESPSSRGFCRWYPTGERLRHGLMQTTLISMLALAAPVLPSPALAADINDVSCSSIELGYSGEATTTQCRTVDKTGIQTTVSIQQLIATTATSELVVNHYATKFNTYMVLRSLRDTIEREHFFSDTDNWQVTKKSAGFEFAVFEGFAKSGDAPTLCAGFARYSGEPGNHFEFPDGPGYKNLDDGIYCVFAGQSALINPVDNFYRVIEDVIGKLRFPQ